MTIRNDGCFLRLLLFKSVKIISYLPNIKKEQKWPGWAGHCSTKGVLLLNATGWPFVAPGQKIRPSKYRSRGSQPSVI